MTTMGERRATGPVLTRSTAPQRPISLSGGRGFQSTQIDVQILFGRGESFHRQHIAFAEPELIGHIEMVRTVGAGDLRGIGDLVAVEPDLRAIVDAAEVQPELRLLLRSHGSGKLIAIPPAAAVGAVGGHGQIREVLADGIGSSGNFAQVVAERKNRAPLPPQPEAPARWWAP